MASPSRKPIEGRSAGETCRQDGQDDQGQAGAPLRHLVSRQNKQRIAGHRKGRPCFLDADDQEKTQIEIFPNESKDRVDEFNKDFHGRRLDPAAFPTVDHSRHRAGGLPVAYRAIGQHRSTAGDHGAPRFAPDRDAFAPAPGRCDNRSMDVSPPKRCRISFAQLNDFDRCPKLFFWKHVERRKPAAYKVSPALVVGGLLHNTLRDCFKELTPEERTPAGLERALRRRWRDHPQRDLAFASRDEERIAGLNAINILRWFARQDDLLTEASRGRIELHGLSSKTEWSSSAGSTGSTNVQTDG